jgi:hypothetical protein
MRFRYAGSRRIRAQTRDVTLQVPALSTIHANDHSMLVGDSVTFTGRLVTGPVPKGGKLMEVQAFFRGRWRTFSTVRTGTRGRWHFSYRFGGTRGVVRYRFRVRVPRRPATRSRSVGRPRRSSPCAGPSRNLARIHGFLPGEASTVIERIRRRCTYANVVATLALFIALGGSSYAALRVGSREIVNNSVRGKDIRNRTITRKDVARNALGGTNIKESRLGTVPRANGLTARGAARLKLRCPTGTELAAGECFQSTAQQATSYYSATISCGAVNKGNRRLPTHAELVAFFSAGHVPAPGGELTANAVEDPDGPEVARVLIAVGNGGVAFDQASAEHPFRCVTNPSN